MKRYMKRAAALLLGGAMVLVYRLLSNGVSRLHSTRDLQTMSEKIVQLNEEVIKGQLKELVRGSVEETLNELLEAEAQKLTQAARYERNEQRQGYRSGH